METNSSNSISALFTQILDLLTSAITIGELNSERKFELLQNAKNIVKELPKAVIEARTLKDEQQDQLTLKFGEDFFNILREP